MDSFYEGQRLPLAQRPGGELVLAGFQTKEATMANHKSSTPAGGLAAPGASSSAAVPVLGPAGGTTAPAGSGTAGSTGPGVGSGGVLAALGVNNTGLNQVKVKGLATTKFETRVTQRLTGVRKFLPAGTGLVFLGQTFTVASIVSVLTAVVDLFTALATAIQQSKAQGGSARTALSAELPTAHQFLTALDASLVSFFGKGNPVLGNFGISSKPAKAPSSAAKAKAVGTAELTRKARNTRGKQQKALVTGGEAQVALFGPDGQLLSGSTPGAAAPAPAPQGGSK